MIFNVTLFSHSLRCGTNVLKLADPLPNVLNFILIKNEIAGTVFSEDMWVRKTEVKRGCGTFSM